MRGIRERELTTWLADIAGAPEPPLTFDLVAGGRTHLTYRVTGRDGHSVALRRTPNDHRADRSDVPDEREHRILDALAAHGAPVPRPLARCDDSAVTGAPFSVLQWVDGWNLTDIDAALLLAPPARAAAGRSFMAALAAVHRLDLRAIGLSDLVRPTSYVDRQIRAWREPARSTLAASAPTADLAGELDRLAAVLGECQPSTTPTVLLHGDYRLDNVIVSSDGEVRAIVDWELAATGDPLADVGYAVVMWEPFDSLGRMPATAAPSFCPADELVDHYIAASATQVDPGVLAFHVSFAAWRAACIGAVVLARYEAGQVAGDPVDPSRGADYVAHYRDRCADALSTFTRLRPRNEGSA